MNYFSLRYSHCIRPEAGFCCVQYTLCADTLSMSITDPDPATPLSMTDSECSLDYVGIVGKEKQT